MTSPTHTQIRNAIAAVISGVTDIGKVHKFERFSKGEKDFRTQYDYNGQVRGWNVRRISRSETPVAVGVHNVISRWRISGFMSLSDADESELVFDTLLDDLCSAFRADETLGDVVASTVLDNPNVAGLQIEDAGPVMFAGVLCHSARGILHTWHIEKGGV